MMMTGSVIEYIPSNRNLSKTCRHCQARRCWRTCECIPTSTPYWLTASGTPTSTTTSSSRRRGLSYIASTKPRTSTSITIQRVVQLGWRSQITRALMSKMHSAAVWGAMRHRIRSNTTDQRQASTDAASSTPTSSQPS